MTVSFDGAGEAPIAAGQTICEAAEQQQVPINAECHAGICGSDPIRILSGAENITDEPSDQERETLEEICELEPGECRLACMGTLPTGPQRRFAFRSTSVLRFRPSMLV